MNIFVGLLEISVRCLVNIYYYCNIQIEWSVFREASEYVLLLSVDGLFSKSFDVLNQSELFTGDVLQLVASRGDQHRALVPAYTLRMCINL